MDFLELAKKRHSVRKYEKRRIEAEKLVKILEAGRLAPTGANAQSQRIIVLQEEGLEKLKKMANVYGAPLALIVCADHSSVWKRPFDDKDIADTDVGIVTTYMMMEAVDLGLGTLWVSYFDPSVIKENFNLPANIEPINILAIGYADETAASAEKGAKNRKPIEDTVFYEKYCK